MTRFRSTLFDRRQHAALPTGDLGSVDIGEAGASSDSWYTDIIGGGPDVNPELSGSQKFPVFDEMALTDPTIKSLLAFWSLTVRSATWGLEPVEAMGLPLFVRDYCAWNVGLEGRLGEMDLSWGSQLGLTVTTGLKHGPSIEELVWDDVRTWHDADGDPHLIRPLARLAPRPARTIARVKRRNGRLEEITQTTPGTRPMPRDKVSYIVFDPDETGRWEGSSMIRPAWAPWRLKKALQISAGIGWDRFASGLPVVFHPDNPDAERRAKRIGEMLRQHERANVHFPSTGPSTQGGRPDSEWGLELLNGAATLADPVSLLRWLNEQETAAGLALWSALGTTQSGSRAVGEVQIDPFFLGVQAIAHTVARERERQVFRRIVAVNFGEELADKITPRLVVSRIQRGNIDVITRALAFLSPLGFHLTAGDEEDLREMLGLGKLGDIADAGGVTRDALVAVMREQGVDSATLAAVVNALPAGMGVARNRVEGAPLQIAA